MKPFELRRTILSLGLAFGLARAAFGQGIGVGQPDVNRLAHEMAEQVRHLGEDISTDLGQSPQGRHLLQDTRELAQAVDEFHENLHNRPDAFRMRQSYAGIDGTWHHLRTELSRPGILTTAVDRAARRVDAVDAQIHQALGLNVAPQGFYGTTAPSGIADTQRLAHALVDRAEALASVIQTTMGNDPNGAGLAAEAARLAQAADAFHDAIDANQPIEFAARSFGPVDALADRVERYVTTNSVPYQVQSAWQSFASVEVLIHQNLGLPSSQPNVQIALVPAVQNAPSPIVALSDQLLGQTSEITQIFSTALGQVPEGPQMLDEAQRLQAAVTNFRQDVGRGLAANQLAFEFREVDVFWQRLARRVNRVARGQIGPNIAKVQNLGETCEQIHRVLGMPGFPPMIYGETFGQRGFQSNRDREHDRERFNR